ncbi:MAG: carboxypeptidase regulatory-like domain-containing protein [Candidatus Kerfeldbacteria bacterium]|nr:carboxypeptidase regulatory-like domain-containing protein [Candidatus Kerfeldbacteria bacterium]
MTLFFLSYVSQRWLAMLSLIVIGTLGIGYVARADDTNITDNTTVLSLSSQTVGQTGVTATIQFTTNTSLNSGTVFGFMLGGSPSSFDVSQVTASSITSSTLSGTAQVQAGGGYTFFLFTITSNAAAGAHSFTIANVTNPSTSSTGQTQISTQGLSGLQNNQTETDSIDIGQGGGDNGGDGGDFGDGDFGGDEGGGEDSGTTTGNNTVTLTVEDEAGAPLASQNVFGYCGMGYQTGVTDSAGQATLDSLPNGNCGVWLSSSDYYAEYEFFTFSNTDTAKTKDLTLSAIALDTTMTITVLDSTGAPYENAYMYMTDSAGREFSGATNSEGIVSFGVLYGSYVVDGYLSSSGFGETTSEYIPPTTATITATGVAVDSNTNELTIQTQPYAAFISGSITAASDSAALSGMLLAFSDTRFRFAQYSNGSYEVGIVPGENYTVKAESTGYAHGIERNVNAADGETVTADFALANADNTVTVNLVDSAGAVISTDAAVFCKDPAAAFTPEAVYFNFGNSGVAEFSLPDGTWGCDAFVNGYVVTDHPTVTVSGAATETLDLPLQAYDALVTVNLQDQDGNSLNAAKFGVFGISDEGYTLNGFSNGGGVEMGALAATYTLRAYVMNGGYASSLGDASEVTVTATGDNNFTITVYALNATLTGTVTDSADVEVDQAIVTAKNDNFEFSTLTDADGNFSMSVVAGTYTMNAAQEDSDDLPTESTLATVKTNETENVNLALQSTTATLIVTPTDTASTAAALSVDTGDCYAYSDDGSYVTDTISIAGSAALPVQAGTWTYGCRVVVDDTVYNTIAEKTATVGKNDEVSANVTVASAGTYMDDALSQFTATADATIDTGDVEVFVPANALDTAGNVSVTISSATDVVVQDGAFPLMPVELVARDSNNRVITGDFNGDITVTFHYTAELLADYGMSEDDLAGYLNAHGAAYATDQGYTVDRTNNTVSITTNHFSTYSLIGVLGSGEKPSKPRALAAKKVKATTALLDWKAPKNSIVTTYTAQLRKYGVAKQSTWKKYKNLSNTQKAVKKLTANTRYQFRVKACNTTGCSKYTTWTKFKTK